MYIRAYDNTEENPPGQPLFKLKTNQSQNHEVLLNKNNRTFSFFKSKPNLNKANKPPISVQNSEQQANHNQDLLKIKAGYRNIRLKSYKKPANKSTNVCIRKQDLIASTPYMQTQYKINGQNLQTEKGKQKVCVQGVRINHTSEGKRQNENGTNAKNQKKFQMQQKFVLDLRIKQPHQKQCPSKSHLSLSNYFPINYLLFRKLSNNHSARNEPEIKKQYTQLISANRIRTPCSSRSLKKRVATQNKSFDKFESKRLNQYLNPWAVENNDDQQFF